MIEKNYKETTNFLEKNKISSTEIISSSNLYNEILKLVDGDKKSILFSNITSFSNIKTPNKVRIRNDNFLKACTDRKKVVLISGIKINDKNLYLIFISSYFYGYNSSTKSSNSFINFDINDLHKFIYDNKDTINIKHPKNSQLNNKYHKYAFYATNDFNFDTNKFVKFFNDTEEITSVDDKPIIYTGHEYFIPQIPTETRNAIIDNYARKCALCSLDKENPLYCPCGDQININYLKENDLSYIHLHHFVPKKYFLNEPHIDIKWEIIHNINNIVPLCLPCHQAIHKGSKNIDLVKNTFNAIIESFKKNNRYEEFENYVKENTKFTSIDDLFEFYKK